MRKSDEGGTLTHGQKRNENTSVPDVAQTLIQPRKPAQQDALPKSLHIQSRRIGFPHGRASRRFPPVSQVRPTPFALSQPQKKEVL